MSEGERRIPFADIPRPKGGVLGSAVPFGESPLEFVKALKKEYGPVSRFRVVGDWWVLLNEPDLIYEVLVRRNSEFQKPRVNKQIFRLFLGNGLVSADGDHWKRHHKMVMPAFHKRRIDAYASVMTEYSEDLVARWERGERRDIQADMTALTLRVVGRTLFDADVERDAPTVGRAMVDINDVLCQHINRPIPVPKWWPSKTNRRKLKAVGDVEAIVKRIINERRAEGVDRGDLLSMLVLAQDDEGAGMDDVELRDEAMTLFFAGHETTANALVWMIYLLARNPEIREELKAEMERELGDAPITVESLPRLPLLDRVVKESMRHTPSVWTFMRETLKDMQLGPYELPARTYIFISPYLVHNDARFYPDPDRFDPDRFQPENEKAIPRGAYVPFSLGPRICIGKAFAMMESKIILGTVIRRADLSLDEGYVPELLAELSLHPRGGLPMTVSELRPASKPIPPAPNLAESATTMA